MLVPNNPSIIFLKRLSISIPAIKGIIEEIIIVNRQHKVD